MALEQQFIVLAGFNAGQQYACKEWLKYRSEIGMPRVKSSYSHRSSFCLNSGMEEEVLNMSPWVYGGQVEYNQKNAEAIKFVV